MDKELDSTIEEIKEYLGLEVERTTSQYEVTGKMKGGTTVNIISPEAPRLGDLKKGVLYTGRITQYDLEKMDQEDKEKIEQAEKEFDYNWEIRLWMVGPLPGYEKQKKGKKGFDFDNYEPRQERIPKKIPTFQMNDSKVEKELFSLAQEFNSLEEDDPKRKEVYDKYTTLRAQHYNKL